MKTRILALVSIIVLLGCAFQDQSTSTTNVTKIVIRLPGKISVPDDDLFRIITDPNQITKIVKFADNQLNSRFGWRPEWDGYSMAPQPFFTLRFYDGENYRGGVGFGGYFISVSSAQHGYRIRRLTSVERKEFLDLIGVAEEEYLKLEKEWLDPNSTSWKRENSNWLDRAKTKNRKKPNN